jgi:outer membrane protein assembly factor BamA
MLYNPNNEPHQWISGAGAVLTSRGTKGGALFHSMSLGQDRIRLFGLISYVHNNTKYTGIGVEAGDENDILDLLSNQFTVQARAQIRVFPHGYVGVRLRLVDIKAKPDANTTSLTPPPPADQLDSTLFMIGPTFAYDTRDSPTQPHSGVYINGSWLFGFKALGDSFKHNKLQLAANTYIPFGTKTVVAARASFCSAGGEVPYYDLCLFGASDDLRGYPAGRYRDRASWAVQAELRQHIVGRWGAVAFIGLGGIAPSAGDIVDNGNLLPSAGLGVRYLPFKNNDIQLRADFAFGKNDKGVDVGISEAF